MPHFFFAVSDSLLGIITEENMLGPDWMLPWLLFHPKSH